MNNQITLQLHAREIKTDKNTFIATTAYFNGKWYKIKFRKECSVTPKTKGLYDLTVDLGCCTLQKGKVYEVSDTDGIKAENDTIWVAEVVNLRQYSDEELKEINRAKLGKELGL